MKSGEIKKIIQSTYDREKWRKILQFLDANRGLFKPYLHPRIIEVSTKSNQELVKHFSEIGQMTTADGVVLPIFEVILNDHIQIERNRVSLNELIKNYILRDAIKGALAVFAYDKEDERSEWRFSFISKNSASEFFEEIEAKETNPKKFTYIFGNQEQHRTAIAQFYKLSQSNFELEDFFEAFSVEPITKEFFEEYKHYHQQFSDFILENETYKLLFENHKDPDISIGKEVRSFSSRLMGRIVFLYFLQKKNWLGASSTQYTDGSPTFLSDLFNRAGDDKNHFYAEYLCPLFFNALNNPNRNNDEFKVKNGDLFCIPFLNGGLFEEKQEPKGHQEIQFPAFYFDDLFNFFNSYNFTVYENSPEEHTVAVDPEMLGHIFENLIEYNKDTGAYYTPKEIVQYMTRESLIEYLHTHLKSERQELENLIKNQDASGFENGVLKKIDSLIDAVKTCDPAIGSGAFPMGMLQEIFNLKALIHFNLGYEVWAPAKIKQNIIQNSIYGVDLDMGAIDIARLRFWLSLVVDEEKPKPLPNLDYHLMQGNSLIENFHGIDLSKISRGNDIQLIEQADRDLFGNLVDSQMKTTFGKSGLAEEIDNLTKQYFTAHPAEKQRLKDRIDYKVSEHIEFNIELRENSLDRRIAELESTTLTKKKQKQELKKLRQQRLGFKTVRADLMRTQNREEKPYFLWRLFFGEIFEQGGFDIVIGNPPYIQLQKNGGKLAKELKPLNFKTFKSTGDIYCIFYEKGMQLLKSKGILTLITSNKWMRAGYGKSLRKYLSELTPVRLLDLGPGIFQTAIVDTNILIVKNEPASKHNLKAITVEDKHTVPQLKDSDFTVMNKLTDESWVVLSPIEQQIKSKIEKYGTSLEEWDININYGIKTGFNEAFIIDGATRKMLIEEDPKSDEIIRPILRGRDIKKYKYDFADKWLINTHNGVKEKGIEPVNINDYPAIKKHLDKYYERLEKRHDQGVTPYNLRNCAYMEDFNRQKIIWKRVGSILRFSYDNSNIYALDSTCFATGRDVKYLVAFLNSKVGNYLLQNSPKTGTGDLLISVQAITPLLVPKPPENVIQKIEQILEELMQEKDETKFSILTGELDLIYFKLYEFSKEEIEAIGYTETQ